MIGDLKGKVAVVTGSGQGIGEGIARVFSAAGAKVVVVDIVEKNAKRTVNTILDAGGEAIVCHRDIGSRTEVEAMIADTIHHYGRVDIMIHNAAVYPIIPIEDLDDSNWERTLTVNLTAGFRATQACLPYFRKQGGGRIIFTSSVTGPRVAMPGTAHYAASKGAINAFIKTAALEFGRENITVNGVEPGYILTSAMDVLADPEELKEMARYIPKGHLGDVKDIANTMLFLASEEGGYITGQTIVVDGGSTLPESPVVLDQFYSESR